MPSRSSLEDNVSVSNGSPPTLSLDTRLFLKILGVPFFLFLFNPYVSFYHLPSDQQPLFYLFGIPIFFLLLCARIDKVSILLFIPACFALGLISIDPSFLAVRSSYNYVSFFFVFFVSLGILKYTKIDFMFVLKLTFWAWFLVGFIQQFFPDFLSFLVNNARTTSGRGVTALATEPTYYGVVMLFYILFFQVANPKFKAIYVMLATLAVLAFARSAMAALFLASYFVVVLIFSRYWSLRFFSIGVVLIAPFSFGLLPDSRMKSVLLSLADDPVKVVLVDASVNDRFFHVFLSLKGFLLNLGFPHGFTSFTAFAENQISIYAGLIIAEWFSLSGRIMSGLGAALFELGIFGVFYIFVPLFVMFPLYKKGLGFFVSTAFLFFVIFASALPLGFSFFPLFLSFVYYVTRYRVAA